MNDMQSTALRLYGANDLRLETFELPPIKEDEMLVKIISDSICMSSYKAAMQGAAHKRVPDNVAQNPVILGHEFCSEIIEVGAKWADQYKPGQHASLQPALKGTYDATGYTFPFLGGNATYGIIPSVYIEAGNVIPFEGESMFYGSLSEPLSCVIGAVHACYHTTQGEYVHDMDIKEGGCAAILAGAGPMGLVMIDYLIHRTRRSKKLVVTDIDEARLIWAKRVLPPQEAAKNGVELIYLNTGNVSDPVEELKKLSDGMGFDEVFVFAPVAAVVEQADAILAYDGCLNFFAGPSNPSFTAKFNFYNAHYNATHIVGTSGGNTLDMRESLDLASQGLTNPALLVTHIGGLDAAKDTTLNLPNIPGGKKLIYNHISLPLTAIADFAEKGKTDPLFLKLAQFCDETDGLWNLKAEQYLLQNAPALNPDMYRV